MSPDFVRMSSIWVRVGAKGTLVYRLVTSKETRMARGGIWRF